MISAGSLRHAVRLGIRGLAAHRLRSGLTALGIVLGVASVIVMLAIGEAARYQALKQLQDLGANTIMLKSTKPTEPPKEGAGADMFAYGLTYADLDRFRSNLPTVTSATPMREFRKNVWHLEKKTELRMVSVTPDFLIQNNIPVLHGRGIESQDEAEYATVAVLGESAANELFPALDPIGRTVLVEGGISDPIPFRVVGVTADKVLATGGASGDAAEFSKVIFVPFATDRVRLGRDIVSFKSGYSIERLDVSQVTVTVDEVANVSRTADALRSLIDQYHKQKDVQMVVPFDLIRKAEETQRLYKWILVAIAGISLVVGGIGIMNIMLASVTERTREIGVRRALGAKQRDIATQFLVETLVLSCGGGVIGLGLGVAVSIILRNVSTIPTQVEVYMMVVAFTVSVLVGLASGLYPARRAARLDPIEALRHS